MAVPRPFPVRSLLSDVPDADLLRRFVETRDEPAFAELVRRHGPVVYRVCRRLLGAASADDAFQATFLVLACRAARVRKAGSVGSWLVGVAGRVARQMRKRERASGPREGAVPAPAQEQPPHGGRSPDLTDLAAVLDEELTRLPDHLRGPVVVCLLQGRTQDEAVAELGGSVRTLRRRLDEAKRLLRARLERRGVVPAVAAGLAAGVGPAAAAVPPELASGAVSLVSDFLAGGAAEAPAAVLAKGVATTMFARKLAVGVATVAVGLTALGVGLAGDPPKDPPPATPGDLTAPPMPAPAPPPPPAPELPAPAAPAGPEPLEALEPPDRGFDVTSPSRVAARAIRQELAYQRAAMAITWVGGRIPTRPAKSVVVVHEDSRPTNSWSEYEFAAGGPTRATVHLRGPLEELLEYHVPKQMTHLVLAEHFGKPPPRWAAVGMAAQARPADEQAELDVKLRKLLNEGRGLRLKGLFPLTEYPDDRAVLEAQAHSVVRFLMTRPVSRAEGVDRVAFPVIDANRRPVAIVLWGKEFPKWAVTEFVRRGMRLGWDAAAKEVYGFASADALEAAWLDWLKTPEARPGYRPPTPKPEDARIPPTNIPVKQ